MLKFKEYKNNKGVIALVLVIMITALTVISAAVVSMVNVSDLMSSYSFSEGQQANIEIDTCLEDAMFRLASSSAASGEYYLNDAGVNCYYEIDTSIVNGIKRVTSTASTTSSLGYWQDTVIVQINVSSTPIRVESYKHSDIAYSSYAYCGDGTCAGSETTANCSDDCGSSCGDGACNGSETTANCSDDCGSSCGDGACNGSEECGADNTAPACNSDCGACSGGTCGDGVKDEGETCDYTGSCVDSCCNGQVGCPPSGGRREYSSCTDDCQTCGYFCALL